MRTSRRALTAILALALLGGPASAVVAQDIDSETATSELLYEVTIPPELMPPILGKINLERHELEPGFEASIGIGNEAIRGKTLYVAEGELLVTPIVDSWAWRGGAAVGGGHEVAVAGEQLSLTSGEVIYLPAVQYDLLPPEGATVLVNPGATTTLLLGHHAHDSSIPDRFPGWPTGMTGAAEAVGFDLDDLEKVMAGDSTYRLWSARFEPGAAVTPEAGAAMVLASIRSGVLGQQSVSSDRELSMEWPAGTGRSLDTSPPEGMTYTWSAAGDEPLELMMLSVTPATAE